MVHKTEAPDSAAILRVLQTLFVGDPTIRLEVDTASGSILAYARLSQHRSIQATIAEMEHSPQRLEVIPLRVTDPKVAVALIEKLFKSSSSPPIVDGTLDPRQIVIRGTQAQVQQVYELLTSMGETSAISQGTDRGNVREFATDPEGMLDLLIRLQEVWPTVSKQPLRIVGPTAPLARPMAPRPAPQRPDAPERPDADDEASNSITACVARNVAGRPSRLLSGCPPRQLSPMALNQIAPTAPPHPPRQPHRSLLPTPTRRACQWGRYHRHAWRTGHRLR